VTAGIFSDLDGTLIFSQRLLDAGRDITLVERLNGKPQAWMSNKAWEGVERARRFAHLVPVTTRTREQYERIRLPGGRAEYVILSNGARILRDGIEDRGWSEAIDDPSWSVTGPTDITALLERHVGAEPWVREIAHHDNIACVITHRGEVAPDWFAPLAIDIASDHGYTAYPQGRKTHLIPTHVTKEAAAAEVARRLGLTRTIAAGDHQLDAGLMLWADEAIQPAHGVAVPGVPVTRASGVRASEEIANAFLRFAVGE